MQRSGSTDNSEEMLNKWEQIGGDLAMLGLTAATGTTCSSSEIVHIDGLEGEGIKDKEPWDIELTPEELAQIEAQFLPQDYDDEDARERDREEAIDNLKMEKSEAFNDKVAIRVYRFLDEDLGPDDWPKQGEIAAQFEEGTWDHMPSAAKWIEVGRYHGFHELDQYPEEWTKEKLSKYLGLKL
jgi:hypothetical protein